MRVAAGWAVHKEMSSCGSRAASLPDSPARVPMLLRRIHGWKAAMPYLNVHNSRLQQGRRCSRLRAATVAGRVHELQVNARTARQAQQCSWWVLVVGAPGWC